MTRQLATLLAANLTVVDALTALIEQTENRTLQRTLIQVRETVLEGGTLAAALGQHRRVFSPLFVNMVRAGEASGALSLVMLRLADFSERQLGTRKKITAKSDTVLPCCPGESVPGTDCGACEIPLKIIADKGLGKSVLPALPTAKRD